ncbi:MAG: apolipoprotein N-acyltransferase [Myxococcota bacterium]|jgi:apolipoprotein N-acyltransferase|nr:apolipoprotein N-acyltransferase [Myxococcota bacterium]
MSKRSGSSKRAKGAVESSSIEAAEASSTETDEGPVAQAEPSPAPAGSEFRFYQRFLLSVGGGAAVFLAFPTFDIWPLAYVALIPLLYAIRDRRPVQAFGWGALFGFVTNLGGFYWLSGLLRDFGHLPGWLAWLLCLLLVAYQGLVFAISAAIVQWVRRRLAEQPMWAVGMPVLLAIEFAFPMLFPWYYGNSQYLFLPAVQVAELLGVLGVSAQVFVVNFVLYELSVYALAARAGRAPLFPKRFVVVSSALVLASLLFGVIRLSMIEAQMEAAPKLRIGMVEANIGIWEKEHPDKLDNNIVLHQQGSVEAVEKGAQLLVWPESSYQSPFIWGSTLRTEDVLMLEADSLFVPAFRERLMVALRLTEAAFGQPLHRYSMMHVPWHQALERVAKRRGYGERPGSYPFVCGEESGSYLRCPFRRVPPDDVTFLLPGYEPLRADFRADRRAGTLPWNQLAVKRGFTAPLLFGSVTIRSKEGVSKSYQELLRATRAERDLYNVALLLDEYGRVRGNYKKVYLLLFGETIPLAESFPWIYEMIPEAGSFTAGEHAAVFELDGVRYGMMVCYEDIIPVFTRRIGQLEPQVLINVTNDAWFGKTSEPYLHLALATMRAVENRAWLVRSTNTGVTAFVDATGRLVSQTSLEDAETLVEDVAIMPGTRTVYTVIGDILGWLAWGLMLFLGYLGKQRGLARG